MTLGPTLLMFGYYNESTFVRRQIFCWLFVKYNQQIFLGINQMGLSAPREDFYEIIALHPVKILLGINPMGISAPWADSLDIIILKPIKNC